MGENDRELLELAAKHEMQARMVAHILGPSSAAQLALDEAERIRKTGGTCAVICADKSWVVVRAAAEIGKAIP